LTNAGDLEFNRGDAHFGDHPIMLTNRTVAWLLYSVLLFFALNIAVAQLR
jgi:hypothetical protein